MLGLAATCVVAAALLAAGGASAIGVREYSFLNSLRDYSGGGGTAVGVPGDGTKVPWWLGQMVARSMGRHTYAANAQFGFVDGWLNQLQGSGGPSVQLGYSNVGELGMTENSWNNFNTVNTISFVAGNFFTHLAPSERATFYAQILDLTASSGGAAGADKWLYAGWPAFDAFGASGGGVGSVTPQQYTAWRAYALGDYDTWMQGLVAAINSARPTLNPPIRLLPVNRVLVRALEGTALSALSPIDLFVDDAPHGGQTIYLLAAMVNYMAYFNEQPPASIVSADPNVNSVLVNNFAAISQFMWNEFNLATSGTGTPPPPSTTGMAPPPTTTGMAPPGSAPSSPPPPPGAPSTPPSPPPPSTTGTTGFPTLSGGSNQTIVSSDSASLSAAATLAVVAAAVAH